MHEGVLVIVGASTYPLLRRIGSLDFSSLGKPQRSSEHTGIGTAMVSRGACFVLRAHEDTDKCGDSAIIAPHSRHVNIIQEHGKKGLLVQRKGSHAFDQVWCVLPRNALVSTCSREG